MSTNNFAEERQNKPFFHSEELTLFDKWSIGIYLLMTIFVAVTYNRIDVDTAPIMIIIYVGILQLCAYFLLCGYLRNFRCYLVWFGFSMIHLVMYFVIKDDSRLQMAKANPAALLRNTFILLLFFQLLRYASFKMQHQELVVVSKTSKIDDFDHRKITIIDKTLFFAYFAAWGALVYFSFPH